MNEPRINERIRVPEVRLVGPQGEQVGIVRIEDALRLAQEADLDLVEVAPTSRPPVAKLMDYGKFKYEAAVKAREARRNQVNTELKEMRFRLKIDEHDYETKKGHVIRFLNQGDKVKVTIMFRGREQSRPEMGRRLLHRLAEDVADLSVIENAPSQEGRNMSLVLGPLKKKAEARDAARKEREAKKAADDAERASRAASKEPVAPKVADPNDAVMKAEAPAKADAEAGAPATAPAKAKGSSTAKTESATKTAPKPKATAAAKASDKAEPATKAAPKPKAAAKPGDAAKPKAAPKPKAASKPKAKAPAKADNENSGE
ncbi:MAG: translation initiation factor IF-3 [Actinobacteria bacterium HGW-Actinobacteria-4]|nr:MAG: translation initiation factor IF-3 [Actinobacteria bacterium HGW-Actinobacteria-4]